MTEREIVASPVAAVEEIQQGWHELKSRVGQLEVQRLALQQENNPFACCSNASSITGKIAHELVIILTSLVTKLPLNDVGGIISRLVRAQYQCQPVSGRLGERHR